jgi:hypothetical protein
MHATIGRFARWGLMHGPVWGAVAALLGGIPLSRLLTIPLSEAELIAVGLLAGFVGGPILAVVVGATCLAADRVPRWILDAPDYVAVLAVLAVVALVAGPVLSMADAGAATTVVGVALLSSAPIIDAARSAPQLLHPAPARRAGKHQRVRAPKSLGVVVDRDALARRM